jgi:hypothetical protein
MKLFFSSFMGAGKWQRDGQTPQPGYLRREDCLFFRRFKLRTEDTMNRNLLRVFSCILDCVVAQEHRSLEGL